MAGSSRAPPFFLVDDTHVEHCCDAVGEEHHHVPARR